MMSALIIGLALMTILCLLLGWACYRLITEREQSMEHEASRRKERMEEKKEMDSYL